MSIRTVATDSPARASHYPLSGIAQVQPWPAPDALTSGRHFLVSLAGQLRGVLFGALLTGVIWAAAQASIPAILGVALDQGLIHGDTTALWFWAAVLVGIGVIQGGVGALRHRFAVTARLASTYWTTEIVDAHCVQLGAELSARVGGGEVVSVVAGDIPVIGSTFELFGQVAGSLVAFLGVAILLLCTSVTLGLVVLVGVPVLLVLLTAVTRPLQRRMARTRGLQGELNARATDIVGGLRVLRGVGGEEWVRSAYETQSQQVRWAGVHAARIQSALNALQVLLPGAFVVIVVWLGARLALTGSISPGELVAFYGYAAFLLLPLRTVTAFAARYAQACVAADHVAEFLRTSRDVRHTRHLPYVGGLQLRDDVSGAAPAPGRFTVLAADNPQVAAQIIERLGGYVASGSTYGPHRVDDTDRTQYLAHVTVNAASMAFFTGTLRDQLDPHGTHSDTELYAAVNVATAHDVVAGLDGGLAGELHANAANLSGGQRQRISLARALVADPDVLLLVDPTSAVDAHTESSIAQRLRVFRTCRTTVVASTSPLLLEMADQVIYVDAEIVDDVGTHRELFATNAGYRAMVQRSAM